MRAQEAFKMMMREQVAPALRQLGFKGSGQAFTLPSDEYWALAGFQKSVSSNAQHVRFTVNLTVVSRQEWAEIFAKHPTFGAKPKANVHGGGWHARIGQLLADSSDHWWWVEPDRPTEAVGREAIAAIRDYGLPEMQRHMR
jgi:hypothetical protein